MPFFRYKAYDLKGKEVEGLEEASSIHSLKSLLKTRGLYPFEIQEISQKEKERKKSKSIISLLNLKLTSEISDEELVLLLYEIGLLLNQNVHITQILDILSEQTENRKIQETLLNVKTSIQEGTSIADALKSVNIFPEFLVEMVRAGEESGALDKIFLSASEFLEMQISFKNNIKKALMYPSMVIILGIIAMLIMMNYVVPTITKLYSQFGKELPTSTKIVIKASQIFKISLKIIPVLAIILFIGKRKLLTKDFIDKLKLKLPFFKKLHLYSQYHTWANTMGILVSGGLTLDKALEIANKTISNIVIQKRFDILVNEVRKGKSLSALLKSNKILPDNIIQLIAVGEETAKLDDMFLLVAKIYKKHTERLINIFLTYLEPFILIILSLFIGFFIYATIIPMFSLKIS